MISGATGAIRGATHSDTSKHHYQLIYRFRPDWSSNKREHIGPKLQKRSVVIPTSKVSYSLPPLGAIAAVTSTLVAEHGVEYLLLAIAFTGIMQIAAGAARGR